MTLESVHLFYGDIPHAWVERAMRSRVVSCDIETTGLDLDNDSIGTFQACIDNDVAIVRVDQHQAPPNIMRIVEDESVSKIFHHAPFDLRFMVKKWNVAPSNIACTKIASKIMLPGLPSSEYSLAPLVREILDVTLNKEMQTSDWAAAELSPQQLEYAADDVRYLKPLLDALRKTPVESDLSTMLQASYDYLPTRVALDLLGAGDVFAY